MLYYAHCSVVLARLGEAWNPEEVRTGPNTGVTTSKRGIDAAAEADFFTLSFDLLLEPCLLNDEMLNLR